MDTPVLKCEASGTSSGYLYIQSCPRAYNDSQTRRLCEEEYEPEEKQDLTLDQFARVSDSVLEVVYHNKYCALCNGALQPVQWEVKVDCDHFLAVYTATTFDQLLTLSLQPESSCQVKQLPLVKHLTPCNGTWFRGDPISKCNVTGFWQTYDADVERACLQLRRRSYNVYLDTHHSALRPYANIFCAICNLENYPTCETKICKVTTNNAAPNIVKTLCSVHSSRPILTEASLSFSEESVVIPDIFIDLPVTMPRPQPPLSLILGFRHQQRKPRPVYKSPFTFNACSDDEWSSPDGLCLKVHCTSGKVLDNGACITAFDQIRGLGYRLDLWLSPGRNQANNLIAPMRLYTLKTTQAYLETQMKSFLNDSLDGYHLLTTMFVALDNKKGSAGTTAASAAAVAAVAAAAAAAADGDDDDDGQYTEVDFPISVWSTIFLTASESVSRDDFENQLQDFASTFVQRKSTDLTPNVQAEIVPMFLFINADPASLCANSNVICRSSYRIVYSKRLSNRDSFLKWSSLLTCPYVQLNDSHYTVHQAETFDFVPRYKLTLTLGKATMSFLESQELTHIFIDDNNMLRICADILNSRLKQLEEDRLREFYNRTLEAEDSTVERAQYYLTLVCLGASIVCLVLTLVTYLTFKVLRNPAGMNNIFLSASLLLAQAFLLASYHVDGSKTLCTVLGMMTHFLWLWMFAWSFICCFHMFRVFTSRSRRNGTCCCRTPHFLLILALSVAGPVTVIAVVIVASLSLTSGHRTGYGYDACYLDTPLLVGLATFLPVCLVTVSNIVFFAITMAKIYSIRKLQSTDALKSKDRQNFLIYIKLSTITGAFWLVLILVEALNIDVLRFIAIVTNGLQGVFIFLSYVCNKRVFNLYKERFRQKSTLTSLDAFPRSLSGIGQIQQSSTSDKVSDNWERNIKTTLEWTVSEKIQKKTTVRKD
ncbi:G-protein coupled receptor mth [Plakobranchus ocellatus]|uniref:G-protein coupled receptor mth n=1 Tax=Plakobranchus ocellatus TaxID=259542 RepID=A0AAV4CJ46_9GAST|nr:G-protein coupled receptor mth [Plakobranchus ocellatus]